VRMGGERPKGRAGGRAPLLLHVTTVPMTFAFFRGQIGYMRDRGLAIHAASSPGSELVRFGREARVPVTGIPMERRITPLRDLWALTRLVRLVRRIRPIVIHGHTPKGGLLAMMAGALARTPVRIYHMRGLPLVSARGPKRVLLRLTERAACRLAHRVLCVSRSVRQEAVRAGLCPPSKITVLAEGSGNGVDAAGRFDPRSLEPGTRERTRVRLGIPQEARVVGFVGRMVRDKGIVEAVEAWRILRERHPDLRFLLVGPFEARDPVPRATRRVLEEDPRVILAGTDWNTPPLYAAMDVVVLPTHREGFPNVPLEAAAMELPVVATRVPGCVDAVDDGRTGTLVPSGDHRALARALHRYLVDPGRRRRHGAAGRARVLDRFRPEAVWAALHAEYLRLLRERAPDEAEASAPNPPAPETTAKTGDRVA
jgi:glycosyltransferase involved in cell wall biosynthesis